MSLLGSRLRLLREQRGYSLSRVANEIGISVSNLSKYERNTVKPTSDIIVALSDYFSVSTDWLLKGVDPQTQKVETLFDPDLKRMTDILKELMENGDQNLRGWTIIQFQEAFKQQCAAYDEKKLHA